MNLLVVLGAHIAVCLLARLRVSYLDRLSAFVLTAEDSTQLRHGCMLSLLAQIDEKRHSPATRPSAVCATLDAVGVVAVRFSQQAVRVDLCERGMEAVVSSGDAVAPLNGQLALDEVTEPAGELRQVRPIPVILVRFDALRP